MFQRRLKTFVGGSRVFPSTATVAPGDLPNFSENFAVNSSGPNYLVDFAENSFDAVHGKEHDGVARFSLRQSSRFSFPPVSANARHHVGPRPQALGLTWRCWHSLSLLPQL
jgi:hypothetical protein